MDNDEQERINQHKASVQSRFNKIKIYYETQASSNPKAVQKVRRKSKLDEFEDFRRGTNFSSLAEQYGYHSLLQGLPSKGHSEELEEILEKVKDNIIVTSDDDFQSKVRKFGGKVASLTNFIQESNNLFSNYEKEIELLRSEIQDLKEEHMQFNDLEIELSDSEERKFEILADPQLVFISGMKKMKDPTIDDICKIYNEKIADLFDENSKANILISSLATEAENKKKLEKKLLNMNKTIEEKNEEIRRIDEMYRAKFEEAFTENDRIAKEIDPLKKQITERDTIINLLEVEAAKFQGMIREQKQGLDERGVTIKTLTEEITALHGNIQTQGKEIIDLKTSLQSSEGEKTIITEKLMKKTQSEDKLTNDFASLKDEYLKLKEKFDHVLLTNEQTFQEKTILLSEKEKLTAQSQLKDKAILDLQTLKDNLLNLLKEKDGEIKQFKSEAANNAAYNKGVQDQCSFTKELILDYIYCLYLYEGSLNVQQIVENLLDNFKLFLNTSFLRKDDYHLSFTIMNEFIEDVFFRVYDKCMMKRLSQGMGGWMVNPEDMTAEIINELSAEMYSTNLISSIAVNGRKTKSLDTIIELFMQKYDSIIGMNQLKGFLSSEIKPALLRKVEKYKRGIVNGIQTLIEYAVSNIKNGEIYVNGKVVYSFKNYFNEFPARDISKPGTLIISHSNLTQPEAMDNILTAIKANAESLKCLILQGNLEENPELPLMKLSSAMMVYCPMLEALYVQGSILEGYLLQCIIKLIDNMKHLKYLDLTNNSLGDEGLRLIVEALKPNKSITSVILTKNSITTNGGFYLADALIKNKFIDRLVISHNIINDSGISSLLTVLGYNNSTLKELDISNNSLLPEDFQSLADLMQKNPPLFKLNLSENQLDSQSSNFLGIGLLHMKNLRVLDISRTSLNEESAPLLLKHLNESKLEVLTMDENPLGEVGTIVLANILKCNSELKLLSLKSCGLSSIALSCIGKAILQNSVIEEINLEGNSFDEGGVMMFLPMLKDKKVKVLISEKNIPLKMKDMLQSFKNVILR